MQLKPFWQEDHPRPENLPVCKELPESADVAIVGSGYTGLSAARTLVKKGASVVFLERETIGWGASSRNGGITGCGLKAGSPFMEIPHRTYFFYRDKAWFLPFAAYFFRLKDQLS